MTLSEKEEMKVRENSEGTETIVRIGGDTVIGIETMMKVTVLRESKAKVLKKGIDTEAVTGVGTVKGKNTKARAITEKVNVQKGVESTAIGRGVGAKSTRTEETEKRGEGTTIDLDRGRWKEMSVLFLRKTYQTNLKKKSTKRGIRV